MNRNLVPPETEQGEMSILDHLTELRIRLIRSLIAITLGFSVCLAFSEQIFYFLAQPLLDVLPETKKQMVFTSLPEVFFVYMKVSFFAGVILTSPVLFYQLWKFVAPALYKNEKKYLIPFVLTSTLFFLMGASFGYYQVFPWGFRFFIAMAGDYILPMITMRDYLALATRLLLAFGLIFEMPILSVFLAKLGILTPQIMRRFRKYAILLIFIVAAILTPPDAVTQCLMATPMLVLYEISILATQFFGKKQEKPVSN